MIAIFTALHALHCMQLGLDTRKLSICPSVTCVDCDKTERGSKTQNSRFPSKIALCLKKVCYKVSLCENCQRQSCNAFTGLSIRAKMIGRGTSLLRKILADTDPPPCKTPIFNLFRSYSASAVTPSKKVQLTLLGSLLRAFQ